jgi:hypothetical protein
MLSASESESWRRCVRELWWRAVGRVGCAGFGSVGASVRRRRADDDESSLLDLGSDETDGGCGAGWAGWMSRIFSSTGSAARTGRGRLSQFGGIGADLIDSRVARKYPVFGDVTARPGEDRGIGLAGKRVGLGRRRVAWTAMAQPMHSDARPGAAAGRRRFQHVAEAGHARVALGALTEGRSEQRRCAGAPPPANILAQTAVR